MRVIECEGLSIEDKHCDRKSFHPITLTPTSGYLANLDARAKEFKIDIEKDLPKNPRVKSWKTIMSLGSEHADSPLSLLRLPETIPSVLFFQHRVNRIFFESLKKFVLQN